MKVLACVEGVPPAVAQYRLLQPLEALAGADYERVSSWPVDERGRLTETFDADVAVFLVPMSANAERIIRELQAQGVKVVVDVDDDFRNMPSQHQAYWACHPSRNPALNWNHLCRACDAADLVTSPSEEVAARYGRGHGQVLRNYVPAVYLDIPRGGDRRTVGWYGSVGVHPNDLQETYGGVATAVREANARFMCVGSGKKVKGALSLDAEPDATGWVDYSLYPFLVARFDVGIAPLCDTAWGRAKAWLKPLEYAALGVPFVASGVYRPIVERLGVGLLAQSKGRHWRRQVAQLLGDESLRWEQSEKGRQAVREGLTIEGNAWRWLKAWSSVLRPSQTRDAFVESLAERAAAGEVAFHAGVA